MWSLLYLIFLASIASSISIGSKDGRLDPGRIVWPKETWVNTPIELSRTNAGLTVSISFNFRPSTSLSDGYIQIILPSDLSGSLSTTMPVMADQDITAIFSLTLPSHAGVYGPFGIITRTSSTGQIIDANYIFGCIATTSPAQTLSSLTVSTYLGLASPSISTTDSLYFTFSLTSSLWKHDLIEIIPAADWTVSSYVKCSSIDITGVNNLLYGYNDDHNLPCGSAASSTDTTGPEFSRGSLNSVYIYGIDRDVIISSPLRVSIMVSTFTLPGFVKSSWANTWIVKIWRFGTNNLLVQYAGTGPVTTAVGPINFSSWTPISDIDSSMIPSGFTLFTRVTFSNSHDIPKDGSAVIYFSNVDISGNWWIDMDGSYASGSQCYISSQNQGATCTITNSYTVTITFSEGLSANSVISICLLTALSVNAKISAITTYYDETINIDSISNPYSWPFNADVKPFGWFQHHGYKDKTNPYPAIGSASPGWISDWTWGGDITEDLYWAFLPNTVVTWTTSTIITVHLPISQVLSFSETYIAPNPVIYDIVDPLTSSQFLINPPGRSYSLNGNVITVKFPTTPTALNYFVFSYTGNSALPFVSSNLATFYECWAKSQTDSAYELGNSVFFIRIARSDYWGWNLVYTQPLCLSSVGAIPLLTHFTAWVMELDFTSLTTIFTIEITIPNAADLGTALPDGSDLPCSAIMPDVKCKLFITNSGADSLITIQGLQNLEIGDDVYVYISKGIQTPGISYTPTTFVYFTTAKDPKIKNYIYKRIAGDEANPISYTNDVEVTLTASSSTMWDVSSTRSLSVTGASTGTSTNSGTYIGIGLPVGFKLSDSDISIDGHYPSSAYKATNEDDYSVGGFILGIDDGVYTLAGAGSNIDVSNIIAPGYAGQANGANNVHFNIFVASTLGGACDASDVSSLANKINVGIIANSDVSCSSSASSLRGPDSVDSTMTIAVNLHYNIPAGGIINLSMDNNWIYNEATCSVSGITASCSPGITTIITLNENVLVGSMTIIFLHILPPILGSTASCVSTITIRDSKSNYIASGGSFSQAVPFSSSAPPGTSKISPVAIPNFAGAVGVDIYVTFSLTKSVPAGGILYISPGNIGSWLRTGDIKDYCWSNIVYTSCNILGSDVQFFLKDALLSGTTVQLYLDSAITLPSDEGVTSSGFKIISKWNDVIITSDSSPGYVITVNPPCDGSMTLDSVTQSDVQNAGEEATYVFSFSSDQEIVNGDYFIIQFPRNFDPYIGDADNTFSDCEPYDWYLDCSSVALGNIICKADHWYLKISGATKSPTALSSLDLTINTVRSPAAGTTGYFNLWHYGSSGSLKAFINSDIGATTSDLAKNLLIFKALILDNNQVGSTSTYSFDFYCEGTLTSDYIFKIKFPQQFNLKLTNGDSAHCNTKYYDDSGATKTDPTVSYDWNNVTTCSVNTTAGTVTLSIPDTLTKKFSATSRIRINLIGIANAQWGLKRADNMWDSKDTAAFGSLSYWTNKFAVNLINKVDKTIVSKSYSNLHGGYAGFGSSTIIPDINSYNPFTTSGKVHLVPGTQSKDIKITVPSWPMRSKSLKLIPISNPNYPDNGNLEFTSVHHEFIIYQMTKFITFRVSAKIGTAAGIYYIDWGTSESRQLGLPNDLYSSPVSLLVEVCTTSALAQISVADIPKLYRGYKSIPIAISLSQSPATELIISLQVSSADISVYPNILTYEKDTDVLYFELSVSTEYDLTQASPVLIFSISGIDRAVFGSLGSKTLEISSTDATSDQPLFTISTSEITENSATLTILSPQTGVLYWGFSCEGAIVLPFKDLRSITAETFLEKPGIYSYQKRKDMDYASMERDIDWNGGDVDINSFFRRMHSKHCTSYYTNSQVIYADISEQVILDNLMVNTSYAFFAYIDNNLGDSTSKYIVQTNNFTTQIFPTVMTQAVIFSWIVPQRNSDPVRYVLAKNLGVNPSWLTPVGYSTSRRRLFDDISGTTTFTYNVLYDRSTAYSPSSIVENLDEAQASKDFSDLYSYDVFDYKSGIVVPWNTPLWVVPPVKVSVYNTVASFNATSSQNGIICAMCTDKQSDQNTYAWQVLDEINANLYPGHGVCVNSTADTNINFQIFGLTSRWHYTCYFTACNKYPEWPACIDFSEKAPLVSIPVWTTPLDDDDCSIILQGLFFVFIFLFT